MYKRQVFFLLEGVSHCKGFTVMLKQNVAERLFMEGPGQEKGTAVETAVLIAYAVFCAWGLVRMAAQAIGCGASRPACGVNGKRGISGCS